MIVHSELIYCLGGHESKALIEDLCICMCVANIFPQRVFFYVMKAEKLIWINTAEEWDGEI